MFSNSVSLYITSLGTNYRRCMYVCLSHLSSTSSLTSRKSKRARIVTSSSHCVTSFEFFIVHWNFCNHFRIMKKKKEKREGQALTYTYIYNIYSTKKKRYVVYFSASSGCKKHKHVLSSMLDTRLVC